MFSTSSTRDSIATFLSNAVPLPAASSATLFDFEESLGPQAESTPSDNLKRTNHPTSRRPAPHNPLPTLHTRRSSIVYIKSDENDAPTNPITSPRCFSRAIRQLVPQKSILQRKQSLSNDTKPGRGLRPLRLLQDRDTNLQHTTSPASGGARSLFPGKQKQQQLTTIRDDNDDCPRFTNKKLKQLQLARYETGKQRGVLRVTEVLPEVVVRPPSTSDSEFMYGYAN